MKSCCLGEVLLHLRTSEHPDQFHTVKTARTMKTMTTLHEKITQRERIELAGQSSTTIAFALLLMFTTLGIATGLFILSNQGYSALFFITSAFFMVGILYLVSLIWRVIGSGYIKGEMLIVKYPFGKFKVTELRSVRGVKTVRFFGLRLTSIRFRIDGVVHKVLIFGGASYIDNPKTIIDTVRKLA